VLREDLGQLYKTEVTNFQDLDEEQQEKEDRRRVARAINDLQYNESVRSENVLNFIVKCKAWGIRPSEVGNDTPNPEYARIYGKYEQRLKEDRWIDYSNQLIFTDELFKNVPKVKTKWQDRFELIFVDEYQDTDPIQDSIIKALAEEHQNLRVVGDDDQGIYGWRGADIQNILKFEEKFKEKFEEESRAKVIPLGQNYRSTKNIVAASSALADFNPERRDKELFTGNCEGERVKYFHYEDDKEEASSIAAFIHRAKEQGNRSPSDFAVLYRNNKQADAFKKAFKDLDIQYRMVPDSSDRDTTGVSLMTIHKSKGLEFPNVFVAGICKNLLPNYYNRHKKDWDEELRILYVAMTRAKNWLCLSSYEKEKDDQYSRGPSPFLDYIPSHLLESVDPLENVSIPPCPKEMDVLRDSEGSTEYVEPLPEKLLGDGMTVLGIDPGIRNVGWAITRKSLGGYTAKHCTQTTRGWQDTLVQTENKVKELIRSHPDAIAVEKIEVGKEATREDWFLYVAGCVATIRSIAHQHGIEFQLYTPQQVKSIATNSRNASKKEVQKGVMQICNLQEIPEPHHSADAIAASLCYLRSYLNSARFEGKKRKQEHYNSGLAHLENDQYSKAITEFNEARNIDPIDAEVHYGLGRAYLGRGDLVAAENAANETLRLEVNHQNAVELQGAIKQTYYDRGIVYLNNQRYDEAIAAFKEVVRIDSNFINAYCKLGWAYLERDDLIFAENFTKTAPNTGDKYDIWANIMGYPEQNDLVYAEQSANRALKLENDNQIALQILKGIKQRYYERGRYYLEQDDLVSAEEAANEILRLDSNYELAGKLLRKIKKKHKEHGDDYRKKKVYIKAEKSYQHAIRIDDKYKEAYHNLGIVYRCMKDYHKAIEAYRK
ncbi:MAG: crossover junction endodeoxyribonuclease RuvC, partial [Candidatus Poribacteria bacterium]|nr:crossover junction endodeoxyribonuclease RuvC [Candidatus Poribacteria bacterium]